MIDTTEVDAVREFVEELLRSGLALVDLVGSLIDELPGGAFPGEDSAEVLIEMVVGSSRPALEAIGKSECRSATKLIETVWDRVMTDLRDAAALAGPLGSA